MPKRFRIVMLSFWPGLAQIWSGQEVLGLFLGLLFASTLNLAIVSRWIWNEAFAPSLPEFFATLAVVSWFVGLGYTVWWVGLCHPDRHRREIDGLFREAHQAYMQGRWKDSKLRLERILARDESDADALMQLGSLYLRTQQPALARQTFHQCLELKGGAKWQWEIQQALARLGEK
jgi:cytochrome c-type biogenesis protein CcmH/NrfG